MDITTLKIRDNTTKATTTKIKLNRWHWLDNQLDRGTIRRQSNWPREWWHLERHPQGSKSKAAQLCLSVVDPSS
jgi:hypothetical protein